ncbi:MAG TPA: helix-turn-helix domain-containing protein [Candidatus Limnocylindrales bacterium]|nr:helix-turn-helix domain-containing protein [Candidatus Limnocylindrales bacterium]
MNKQISIAQLVNLGLEEVEAEIYLFLLEHGSRTPLVLSRETNIDRSKIYRYVEKLTQKKLIEESNTKWGKKLHAASPKNIELLIQEKEDALKSQKELMPGLIEGLSNTPNFQQREFEVKHYRGQDGLKQMLWNQLSAKKEILAFSYKNKNDIAGKTFAEKIRSEQVERKIMLYEVENETDQGDLWYTDVPNWGKFYKSRYIEPKVLDIKHYTAIFNNTVSISNWLDGEEVGLEIINSTYAQMQKQVFWKFWEISENYIEEGKRIEASKKQKK